MGLLECPDCNGRVSDIAPTCPHCGRPFGEGELTELLFKQKNREQEEQKKREWVALEEERKNRKQEEERKKGKQPRTHVFGPKRATHAQAGGLHNKEQEPQEKPLGVFERSRRVQAAKASGVSNTSNASGGFGKAAGFFVFWTLAIGFGAQSLSGEGGIFLFEHPLAAMLIAIFPAIINYYAVYPRK